MNPPTMEYLVAPHPPLAARLDDRATGHRAILAAHTDNSLGPSPRAAAECLWHYDPSGDRLIVQSASSVRPEILGEPIAHQPVEFPKAGDRVTLTVAIACQKTPRVQIPKELHQALKADGGKCYRSRLVEVPESEREEWLLKRLRDRGFRVEPGTLELSPMAYADLGRRGGRIPYVNAGCVGTVTDAEIFGRAMREGVGKGRNFGLGLLRLGPA